MCLCIPVPVSNMYVPVQESYNRYVCQYWIVCACVYMRLYACTCVCLRTCVCAYGYTYVCMCVSRDLGLMVEAEELLSDICKFYSEDQWLELSTKAYSLLADCQMKLKLEEK